MPHLSTMRQGRNGTKHRTRPAHHPNRTHTGTVAAPTQYEVVELPEDETPNGSRKVSEAGEIQSG